ncbi:Protein RER1 [Aphelenchoides fujianensis]|nr:Protein RER1 [Aphelenchoides fujianensis]
MDDDIRDQPGTASKFGSWLAIKYQHYLDRLTPHVGVRWAIAIFTVFAFCWRIVAVQGFYIVTLKTMKSTLIAFFLTFFEIFDVPVFWPILVMYFFVLTFLTMKRQIMHMIRYRYIPFTFGKPRPSGKEDTGKLLASSFDSPTARSSPLSAVGSSSAL